MKDIRRRSHNLKSKDEERILNHRNSNIEKTMKRTPQQDDISLRTEHYEKREYEDIDYDRSGRPIMKASSHFDLVNGIERKRKGKRDSFDVLKRSEFFNNNRKKFDDDDIRKYRKAKRKKQRLGRRIMFFLIIIGILTLLSLTFVFNRGTIIVNPKYKDVDVNSTFLILKDDFITDTASSTLTKTILKSEPREVNSKAHGSLTIYNNYSDKPQILIKNTRFQSTDGKIFKIADSVTVPGKIGDTPGSIKVAVSADSYGADYNIPAASFTIPGLKGNVRYDYFYAKSDQAMTGGMSGMIQTVAESDINQARSDLTKKVESNLKEADNKLVHEDYYTLVDSSLTSISDNGEALTTTNENTFSITGLASIFSIRETALAKLIAQKTLGTDYNTEQGIRLDNIDNLNIEVATDTEANPTVLKINVIGKARLIYTYDENKLKQDLAGQKLSNLSNLIENYATVIYNARAKLKPVWANRFPKDIKKIYILEEIK